MRSIRSVQHGAIFAAETENHVLLEYISETAAEPEPVADIIALRMELERLEQQQREKVLLKFNDGLPFREIAELAGKNENSIK